MRIILSSFISCLLLTGYAYAEKRSYECATSGPGGTVTLTLNFSIKDADPLDKVSGSALFSASGFKSSLNGTYNVFTDTFLAYVQSSKDAEKKAVTGNWDEDTDVFYLSAKITKKLSVEFACPRKKKKSDLLTGTWVVNENSFFAVQLTEGFDGLISGKGLGSFSQYTVSGLRTNDGEVTLEISSPDGTDDSSYTLKLCGSGATMTGESNSTISPATTICRKNRAISQECQPDSTCQ